MWNYRVFKNNRVKIPEKVADEYWYGQGYKDGDEVELNEDYCYDEFDVVEE